MFHLSSLRRARLWLDGYLLMDQQASVSAALAGPASKHALTCISLPSPSLGGRLPIRCKLQGAF